MSELVRRIQKFFRELRRRNVYKVALTYIVVAFFGLQAAELLIPATKLPPWANELLLAILIIGFPIVLVVTWAFEMSPEGIKRTREVPPEQSITHHTGRKLNHWIIGLTILILLGAAGWWFTDYFRSENPGPHKTSERQTLAVRPFESIGVDQQSSFTKGMAEILNNNLARIEGFRAISQNAVQHYMESYTLDEMVEKLGLDYMIEGSVQLFEEQVRINIQLMNAKTSEYVWSNSYKRSRGDALIMQEEMAKDILQRVKGALGAEEDIDVKVDASRVKPEALKLYLQAVIKLKEREYNSFEKSIDLFNKAIAIDSTFSQAYARRAFSYIFVAIANENVANEYIRKTRQSIDKALSLNPNSFWVYLPLGLLNQFNFKWERAEENFRRAISINPSHAEAHHELAQLLMRLGQFEEALESERTALFFKPNSTVFQSGLGEIYLFKRDYKRAIIELEKALKLEPGRDATESWLYQAHLHSGNYQKAREFAEKSDANKIALAWIYAEMGQKNKARKIINQISEEVKPDEFGNTGWYALVYTALNENEKAISLVQRAVEEKNTWLIPYLKVEPGFDPLRDEPGFKAIEREIFGNYSSYSN